MNKPKQVVVTGATGFIGAHLVQGIRELGAKVRVLVRPSADTANLRTDNVELVYGDLRDEASLAGALCKDIDQVFHLAATQDFGLSNSRLFDINVEGTRRLLQQAIRNEVPRIVLVSSGGIHHNDSGELVCEESPLRASSPYLESKIKAEAIARHLFRADPMRLTIVRPGAVYGPGDRRLLKLFRAVIRGYFVMIGPGTRRIHPVYIDDLVDGLLRAGSESGRGETFLLSGPDMLPLRDWVGLIARTAGVATPRLAIRLGPAYIAAIICESICRVFGVTPPLNRARLGFFINHRSYDLSKARSLLRYVPRISVEDGVRRTLEWYKFHGWL